MASSSSRRPGGIRVSDEVQHALHVGAPVVALESALITHGLPYPDNIETARGLEEDVRAAGAIPATIAVVRGEAVVGISQTELANLAQADGAMKVSIRDLPTAAIRGLDGGTTVAATLFIAARLGIQVFATGGIGGVHRGKAPDVSADLEALGRCSVLVVSAGAKAILDTGATLERLETLSVPVVGFRTDQFPAFYSRLSGLGVSVRLDSPREIAEFWRMHRSMGSESAVLIGNPIGELDEIPRRETEELIERATAEADDRGMHGQVVTPFLLKRLAELSHGRTIEANKVLLHQNARLAAEIAIAVSAERAGEEVPG